MVCSTSSYLLNDILNAVGPSVQQEYANNTESSQMNSHETNGGDLKSHKILFKPCSFERKSTGAFYQSIRHFVRQAVEHAIKRRHTSIAFPAIGCGKINADKNLVAKEMVVEAQQQLLKANVLLQIIFVILPDTKQVFDAFQTQLAFLQTSQFESEKARVCYNLTSNPQRRKISTKRNFHSFLI